MEEQQVREKKNNETEREKTNMPIEVNMDVDWKPDVHNTTIWYIIFVD